MDQDHGKLIVTELKKTSKARYWQSFFYITDTFESRQNIGTKKLKNPKAFTDYLQTIDDV